MRRRVTASCRRARSRYGTPQPRDLLAAAARRCVPPGRRCASCGWRRHPDRTAHRPSHHGPDARTRRRCRARRKRRSCRTVSTPMPCSVVPLKTSIVPSAFGRIASDVLPAPMCRTANEIPTPRPGPSGSPHFDSRFNASSTSTPRGSRNGWCSMSTSPARAAFSMRNSTASRPSSRAIRSTADSSANTICTSPGARTKPPGIELV